MRIRHSLSAAILVFGSNFALGQVINIPQSAPLPPGDPGQLSWLASDAGLNGSTTLNIIVEVTGTAICNSFVLDVQNNGFPAPPINGVTDDIIVFGPGDVPGATATVDIPPGCGIGLFHDVFDETGVFLSGPNGVLDDNGPDARDAYLSSDTTRSYTAQGRRQLIKYFRVSPAHSYQFTSQWDTVSELGSGYRAFIFLDDDHTPNYDYDDMIVGVVAPPCTENSECDDGDICTGVESCVEGVCQATPGVVCDDGVFCNGAEICVDGICQDGAPPTCDDNDVCTLDSCESESDECVHASNHANCLDDGVFCNGIESCDAELGCVSSGSPCEVGQYCDEAADLCRQCQNDDECADSDPCLVSHSCLEGSCVPGVPVNCSASGSECTEASCDPAGVEGNCDVLTPSPEGTPCDDGDECTASDVCEEGICQGLHSHELVQWSELVACFEGPDQGVVPECGCWDLDGDNRIGLHDVSVFQSLIVAP